MPKISIIVPIYNAASYIRRCLDSICSQTEKDWELLLVNDGSTDDSQEIVEAYSKREARIQVYQQENQGQGVARNRALEQARGEFVVFIDADDYVESNYLEQLISAMPGHDVVQATGLCFYHQTVPWGRMFRRDFIETHQIRFAEHMYYEDVIFSLRMWQARPRYANIPSAGYHYSINPHSTTASRHPEDEKLLVRLLKEAIAHGPSRWIALYTYLRIQIHFYKNKI